MLFSKDSIGGWLLGGILFAWQFPHFNALSYMIREEYKAAGYRMLAWTNPAANARVALRYSILMFPFSIGLWWVGVVGNGFLVGSTVANGWLVKVAYTFWRHQGANGSARSLFWASIWQLPILLVGGLVTKKGLWDGVWNNIFGQPVEDEDDYHYEDEDEVAEAERRMIPAKTSSS
jgi:protoheme IX farnesyltransferase